MWETCEIQLEPVPPQSGQPSYRFVARAYQLHGMQTVAVSPVFTPVTLPPQPDDPEVRAAYTQLLQTLEAEGWTKTGSGIGWSDRFRRVKQF